MGKNHIKRLAAPKTWQISKKGSKFIIKPAPGPHNLQSGMPLGVVLKEILNYADTTREVKKIIQYNQMKIDGKIRRDFRFSIGIFDTMEFVNTNEYFRFVIDINGKLNILKIKKEDALLKPCKIIGKQMLKGKLQLNLYDGKNLLVDDGVYKVGDTILLSLPEHRISKHLKLGKKSTIFLSGGKHAGEIGNVEDIIENKVIYKDRKGNLIETSKKYAFVVGEEKPAIKLE